MLAPEMEADGICVDCWANPGVLTVDPYRSEIHGEQVPVVLCGDCYHERTLEP